MDNYTKAGSWELPTYQADLASPQTQAKIEFNGHFKKHSWLLSTSSYRSDPHWALTCQQADSVGLHTQVETGTKVGRKATHAGHAFWARTFEPGKEVRTKWNSWGKDH